jgi:PAS domain S-box-containing protein
MPQVKIDIIRIAYIMGRSVSLPLMWIVRLPGLGTTMLLIFSLVSTGAAAQAPASGKRVLMLYSDERLLPANIIMDEAIRAAFAVGTKDRVEFYSEFLDVARFPGEEQQQRQRNFFRDKYRERPPDLVIAVSGGALVFLAEHRGELFAGVPIVYCSVTGDPHPDHLLDARIAEVTVPDGVAPTLEMMLRLHPDSRQVAVVSGSGQRDRQFADVFRLEMTTFENRIAFTWLTNLSMEELRGELSRLADHTVVLYLTMFQDAAGKTFTGRQALEAFAPASRAPIYGCFDTYLGHGIVGGSMVTFEEIGRKAAQLGIRILAGEDAQAAARSESHQAAPMFDWRELRRWNISAQRLPPGSIVRFKEATYWEQHHKLILWAVSLCTVEAFLIGTLLVQLRRRRLAERSLRDSEERMSLAAEGANLGMWVWDVVRDKIWMTDKGRALFGFAPDARLDYATLISRVHPEDRAAGAAAIKRAIETQGKYAMEYRVLLPDGTLRWIGALGQCLNVGGAEGIQLLGVSMDVTAQKLAQDALRESEARFRTMANTAPVMIWMSGPDKLCIFFNKGWLDFTGRPLEQELGNGWAEGVHREDFDRCFEVYVSSFDALQSFTMEYRLRRSDGEYRWVLDIGSPRFAPDGTFLGYIGSCIDITERKQAEAEARQHREEIAYLSRVAIMGEMAGSLAHELNQPLGAIVTNAGAALRFLERDSLSGERLREVLQDIVADGMRASEVIHTIKGMGRKEEGARQLLHLNDVIAEVLRLTRSDALAHDCTVLTWLHPALPKVEANLVQLQEVFLNLILNAFEALREVPRVQRRVIIRTERDGDGAVRACVRDFGTGLPADMAERIFDRFFSTKRDGMGIGLFIARSIVDAHGGTLYAENAEGGGAQFWLRLPASKEIGV